MKKREITNYLIKIIIITSLLILILNSIPNYLKPLDSNYIGFSLKFIVIFLIIDFILIGIPAGLHKIYVNDYTLIKSIWFFTIFGGITGALIGENNLIMILPYTILMFIYANLYKRFPWWKVASTTYLAGILIENAINRSPMQVPTFLWIAFFTYPYFITKTWENRKKIQGLQFIKDMKYPFISFIILLLITKFIVKSIPWVFVILAIAISLFGFIFFRLIKKT